jgi:hypothetical protein
MQARPLRSACVLLAAAALAGCTNPVDPTGHRRPAGVVVFSGGEIVYESAQPAAPLTLPVGTPVAVRFEFRDAQDSPVAGGDDYYLRIDVPAGAALSFVADEPGAFTGTLTAGAAGNTTVLVRYMHGRVGRGHSDFDHAMTIAAGG